MVREIGIYNDGRMKSNLKGDDDESDEDVDKEEGKDNEVDDVEQRHLDPGE